MPVIERDVLPYIEQRVLPDMRPSVLPSVEDPLVASQARKYSGRGLHYFRIRSFYMAMPSAKRSKVKESAIDFVLSRKAAFEMQKSKQGVE